MLMKLLILEEDMQMEEFERKLPDGFYDSIPMKVEIMAVTNKSVKVVDTKVYNTELIYSKVMGQFKRY